VDINLGTFLNVKGIPNIQKGVSLDLIPGVRLPSPPPFFIKGLEISYFRAFCMYGFDSVFRF
jgi:hypothetical protein